MPGQHIKPVSSRAQFIRRINVNKANTTPFALSEQEFSRYPHNRALCLASEQSSEKLLFECRHHNNAVVLETIKSQVTSCQLTSIKCSCYHAVFIVMIRHDYALKQAIGRLLISCSVQKVDATPTTLEYFSSLLDSVCLKAHGSALERAALIDTLT